MSDHISSPQNSRIKQIVRLNQRRRRDQQQLTVVEGVREIARALANNFVPRAAYICPELINSQAATAVQQQLQQLANEGMTQLFTVTPDVFLKIAYRGESGGLLVLVPYWPTSLNSLALSPNPFLVIIEGGEKPGNLGAVLRSADAAGVHGLIVSNRAGETGTDLFNPNVIRASLGALFTVPIAVAPSAELIRWLISHEIAIGAALPQGERVYTAVDLRGPVALVLGSEAQGLSSAWQTAATWRLTIPMVGQVDSLNLSVATALMLYEVVRQRTQTPEQ